MIEINVDPVAFAIGSVEVRWYGIMIAIGVTVLVLWTLWQVRKGSRISYETVLTGALVGIPAGIIFSRLLHVIDRWDYYSHNPGQIIGGEGLTIYGAVLGATLAVWIYSRFSNFKFAYVADIIAPGVVLAQAIGRVGCTLNGCCYGTATSLPWGVAYTNPGSQGYQASLLLSEGTGLHPTQVYEIIFLLVMFGVLMLLKDRLKPQGSLFLVYLGGYSLWRFSLGFIREGTDFLFGLHQAQVIGITVLAIVIGLMVYNRMHFVKKGSVDEVAEDDEDIEEVESD